MAYKDLQDESESESESESENERPKKSGKGKKIGGCVVGGCLTCYAVLIGVVAHIVITKIATIQPSWIQPQYDAKHHLRTPANVTMYEWWPSTSTDCARSVEDRLSVPRTKEEFDRCGTPCYNSSLPLDMDAFFNATEQQLELVSFPSRLGASGQPTVQISAWWMPAMIQNASNASIINPNASIIVLTHGMSGSNIAMRVLVPAYMLQKLGYSVLLPDLRDHGLSGKSKNPDKESWGAEYHLDVLGAWDWAVAYKAGNDANKVGLMGNSMGGFASASAAGLESKVPALFLDGAVYDPYMELLVDSLPVPSWFAQVLALPAWWLAEKIVGISLRHQTPEKTIPTRTKKLPVGMVYGKEDSLVQGAKKRYTDLFANNPAAAQRTVTFWPDGKCHGDAHVLASIQYPDEYEKKLDAFWSCVFNGTKCVAAV